MSEEDDESEAISSSESEEPVLDRWERARRIRIIGKILNTKLPSKWTPALPRADQLCRDLSTVVSSREKKRRVASMDNASTGFDRLNRDVKLHIFCYLAPKDLASIATTNKVTSALIAKESQNSLDGIRLSYLNNNKKNLGRFGKLLKMDQPATTVMEFLEKNTTVAQITVLRTMFAHNEVTQGNAPQFVIAGGSVLAFVLSGHDDFEKRRSSYAEYTQFGDIDVFVMEEGHDRHISDATVRRVLISAGEEIDRRAKDGQPGDWQYGVVRNSGTLTIVTSDALRPLQIVLRRVSCLEELLCFFDLDCCRFGFDGEHIYSTVEGLRSLTMGRNFVSKEYIRSELYAMRAIKYGHRGFNTGFGFIHPLAHLLDVETPLFPIKDWRHSEEVTDNWAAKVDVGLYTPFANVPLQDLKELAAWSPGLRPAGDGHEDSEDEVDPYDEVDIDDQRDENFNMKVMFRRDRAELKERLLTECGFASNFHDHFSFMQSDLFVHIYYESHLRQKYNISRCYITGKWFKIQKRNQKSRRVNFSPEGWAINKRYGSLKRDLSGKVAIVTGARIKIGYATSLELLRSGATVVATTRFAADAERRYACENDYHTFFDRLLIYPLNLQCVEDVSEFVAFVGSKYPRIHILVNNAAQTVRLPLRCYARLIALEYDALGARLGIPSAVGADGDSSGLAVAETADSTMISSTESSIGIKLPQENAHLFVPPPSVLEALSSATMKSLPEMERRRLASLRCMFTNLHPDDRKDFIRGSTPQNPIASGMNVDSASSWRLQPTQIHPIELFETQTVNHLAPTMLLNGLVPYLSSGCAELQSGGPSYVINVTSIEGQFSVDVKESQHIHTNMSKASLNMLTKSGARFYASRGILVNSVDTGWVSSTILTWRKPPLTVRDGAMRILYPIFSESRESGKLFKNYTTVPW